MNSLNLLGLIAGVSIAACVFLATYFFFAQSKSKRVYKLLGLLFIAIGIRVSKSIMFFIFGNMSPSSLSVGYIALASIGPLLFLYIKSSNLNRLRLKPLEYLHFVLPVIGLFICYNFNLHVVTVLYKSTTVLMLFYIVFALYEHLKSMKINENATKWNFKVILSVAFVWGAFAYQHLTEGILDYAIGAGLASLPIYYLFITIIITPIVFTKVSSTIVPKKTIDQIKDLFEIDKIYLSPDVSLTRFSESQNIPAYLITKAVKELYQRSFPETVNYFRINQVKENLIDEKFYSEKIETLAFEAGFNSLSVFYTAFKREVGMSPSKYKKEHFQYKGKTNES